MKQLYRNRLDYVGEARSEATGAFLEHFVVCYLHYSEVDSCYAQEFQI